MRTYLVARSPIDAPKERQVRKLAHSVHAPADWIVHGKMVARSWDGLRIHQIAEELGCHPQTVRDHLHAFNERGVEGLGMKPGSGRKPRLTEQERGVILALVKLPPPGKPTYELTGELAAPDPEGEPEWTLDMLTERGSDKVWVYGALCVRDGQALTQTASSRNTAGYLRLLQTLDQAYPHGDLYLVATISPAIAAARSGTG